MQPKLSQLLKGRDDEKPFVSFEYFAPKTDEGVKNLHERIERMRAYEPLFADITWGAGGTSSETTLSLTIEAKERHGLIPQMHLTCTNMPVEKLRDALKRCQAAGIRNILALRGDPPAGEERWEAVEGGFTCALDLVRHIREQYGDYFGVSVAGYPEGHPNAITEVNSVEKLSEAERRRCSSTVGEDGAVRYFVCRDDDYARELAYLKKKVDAGAECIFTQMFFDAEVFLDFVRACREVGIQVPILPGILCVNSVAGFRRMVTLCKTRVPEKLWKQLEAVDADNEDAVQAFAVQLGVDLCSRLLKAGVGVPGLHFYTLNLEPVTTGIVEALGLGPFSDEQASSFAPPPQLHDSKIKCSEATLIAGLAEM